MKAAQKDSEEEAARQQALGAQLQHQEPLSSESGTHSDRPSEQAALVNQQPVLALKFMENGK